MTIHRKGPATEVLAAEYNAGATSTDLAAKYGMHHGAVIGRLRRAGHPIRPARRRFQADKTELSAKIVSAYRGGMPMVEIAESLGSSHSTVQRTLKSAGVTARPHGLRRRTAKVPTDASKLGYPAGLLDGEGSLAFRKKPGGVSCRLHIYSTTPGLMKWLIREVGGTVRYDTKRTTTKGWLPIGIWSLYRTRDVVQIVRALLPMLIVKRERAQRVMAMAAQFMEVHDSPPTMTQSSPRVGLPSM